MADRKCVDVMKIRKALDRRLYWIPIWILVIWTVLPLFWTFTSSLKTISEVYKTPPTIFPEVFQFVNYQKVLESANFWRFMFNSVYLSVGSTFFAVIISILAGYGFARYAFRARHSLMLLVLLPRILPRVSLVVPLFAALAFFGLLNTYTGLIVVYIASSVPMATWIMAGYFKIIPPDLEASAKIDGARPWQVMWYILLPISLPAILTVSVLSLRETWNEFPFIMSFTTSVNMRTLPYQLFMLRESLGIQDWPQILAFAIITILPILIIYMIFEKRVVASIMSGAIK